MTPAAVLILPDGREHPLAGDVTIGREPEHEVCLDDPSVSRRHAIVAPRKGRWYVADTGSRNGTLLNGERVPPGSAVQLRHADRLQLGTVVLLFSSPAERDDPERTDTGHAVGKDGISPFQLSVVHCLCEGWLGGGTLDRLPSNREIAERLGTPEGAEGVKAALRRVYARAGLTDLPAAEKRRELCRVARRRGWI